MWQFMKNLIVKYIKPTPQIFRVKILIKLCIKNRLTVHGKIFTNQLMKNHPS